MAFDFVAFEIAQSQGDWAACDACRALIDAGDREGLALRSLDAFILAYPSTIFNDTQDMLAPFTEVHDLFFKQRFGDPEAIDPSLLTRG
jgi:hypothetical protein